MAFESQELTSHLIAFESQTISFPSIFHLHSQFISHITFYHIFIYHFISFHPIFTFSSLFSFHHVPFIHLHFNFHLHIHFIFTSLHYIALHSFYSITYNPILSYFLSLHHISPISLPFHSISLPTSFHYLSFYHISFLSLDISLLIPFPYPCHFITYYVIAYHFIH